jgi:hypothetical protein
VACCNACALGAPSARFGAAPEQIAAVHGRTATIEQFRHATATVLAVDKGE